RVRTPGWGVRARTSRRGEGNRSCGFRVKLQVFDHRGRALAAADAHGYHAPARLAALELVDHGGQQLGAGAAERMAQGDGPAVDVDLVGIEVGLGDDRQRLGGEGLVELDQGDVVEADA